MGGGGQTHPPPDFLGLREEFKQVSEKVVFLVNQVILRENRPEQ